MLHNHIKLKLNVPRIYNRFALWMSSVAPEHILRGKIRDKNEDFTILNL